MSNYGRIEYKGYLSRCPHCGSLAEIRGWYDGIGDVGCFNRECDTRKHYHYSGKCCTSKRQAVKEWNTYCAVIIVKKGMKK